jgi:hypothetical protein
VKRRFTLTAPVVREPVLHKQIADVLRWEIGPPGRVSRHGVTWWSIDMANYGGVAPGLRTGRGCIAGVPDLQVLWRGCAYFVELKARDGVLSVMQQTVATTLELVGCRFGVARDVDEVMELLDVWQIPREHRIMGRV